jgi:hypothetical protein
MKIVHAFLISFGPSANRSRDEHPDPGEDTKYGKIEAGKLSGYNVFYLP